MTKIDIVKYDGWCYDFYMDGNDASVWNTPRKNCSYCKMVLNKAYCYIIENLREAGLLPDDYKLICCYCKILLKVGLIGLKNSVNNFAYHQTTDELEINFNFGNKSKTEIITFTIHDFHKYYKDDCLDDGNENI